MSGGDDLEWIAAWSAEWLSQQRVRQRRERKATAKERKRTRKGDRRPRNEGALEMRARVKREAHMQRAQEHQRRGWLREEARLFELWDAQGSPGDREEEDEEEMPPTPRITPQEPQSLASTAQEGRASESLAQRWASVAEAVEKKGGSESIRAAKVPEVVVAQRWASVADSAGKKAKSEVVSDAKDEAAVMAALARHDEQVWNEQDQDLRGIKVRQPPELPLAQLKALVERRHYELPEGGNHSLGKGAFGSVVRVRRKSDGRLFAIKRQMLGYAVKDSKNVLREASILNVLKGAQHILQIYDGFPERPTGAGSEVWLVLEHFPFNLHDAQRSNTKLLQSEDLARQCMFQLLLGTHAMHSQDIVHRDLKPENILVQLPSLEPFLELRVAICDFGLAKSVHQVCRRDGSCAHPPPMESLRRTTTVDVVTCWWRAPEMWNWANPSLLCQEDLKSLDVFSFGLIWAGVLANRSVIKAVDGMHPDMLRMLEIFRKIDQPSAQELEDLGYQGPALSFAHAILDNDKALLSKALLAPEFSASRNICEYEIQRSSTRLGVWVRRYAFLLEENSQAPATIERITRFSYRKRPSVEEILQYAYFEWLRDRTPAQLLEHRDAPCFPDAGAELQLELDLQLTRQPEARRHRNGRVRRELARSQVMDATR